ncbi:hypothetical protein [Holospora elegans]|uniref:hypothetical protein n=1 Tax=Holospora elegans TaxID=431043 RepID=UPI00139F291E|nr:hypothetical protein [Holospora elegans]
MTTFNALVQHFQFDLVYSIAGLVNNTPIAPMGFKGSCDTVLFQAWVEFLIKELKPG